MQNAQHTWGHIKMEPNNNTVDNTSSENIVANKIISKELRLTNKEKESGKSIKISHIIILIFISTIIIFSESIIILLSAFKKGIIKKQILSQKTNLGFDIIIKKYKK